MRARDFRQVHGRVAHEAVDDIGAEAVILREGIALDGRETAVGNMREMVFGRGDVLHEPLRDASDRTRAEADEGSGGVVRVALDVPAQPALPLRLGEVVVGQSEVIEGDAGLAGIDQRLGDGLDCRWRSMLSGRVFSSILR